jgi:hypothetical protein
MNITLGFFSDFKEPNTILLDGDNKNLNELATILFTLENPKTPIVHIHRLSFVTPVGDITLSAFPVGKEYGIRRVNKLQPHFTWELSEEGWLEAGEKILNVANSNDGHAWIESQGANDAVILVSLGEYGPQWWEMYGLT